MKTRYFNILFLFAGFILNSNAALSEGSKLHFAKPSENRIEVRLENQEPLAALQFTLSATGGIVFQSVSLLGRTNTGGWILSSFKLNDSTMNVVIIRSGYANLDAGTGEIAEAFFEISDEAPVHAISFSRVVASDPHATSIDIDLESIEWNSSAIQPFTLNQNYPNPFNPSTTIPFALSRPARVSLAVYDLAGRQVRKITEGLLESGTHSASWNSTDESGALVPSGIYFVRLMVEDRSEVRKMILTR